MRHEDVDLHNVVETVAAGDGGVLLYRFPVAVQRALSPLGRIVAAESAGCEVRFVTESDSVRVALAAIPNPLNEGNLKATVFKGGFLHSVHDLAPGRINHLVLSDIGSEEANRFLSLKADVRDSGFFHHRVWRILCGRYTAVLHGIDAYGFPVRPPSDNDVPPRRLLCYGSSITNGACPNLHHLSYVYMAGRALRWDVFNQGLSGSCRLEPEVADYLAARNDWDAITLELGVNMRQDTTPEAFKARAERLVGGLIEQHPEKPVILISIYPNANAAEFAAAPDPVQARQLAFDEVLRDLQARLKHPYLHLVEGRDVLTRADGLGPDLIHPSDYGHVEMGLNLAHRLQRILA